MQQSEVRFEAGLLPPVKLFWSETMYRLPERLLVANSLERYAIGDRTPGLIASSDGSLTPYIQRAQPDGDRAANWLPAPDGPFNCILRMYGPK